MKRILGLLNLVSILGIIGVCSSGCIETIIGKMNLAVGEGCSSPSDCASGVCTQGVCAPAPSCSNNMLDGLETDVDCGGLACNPCPNGKHCGSWTDCQSENCVRQNGIDTCQPLPADMSGMMADMSGQSDMAGGNADMAMVSNDMANLPADMASQSDMVAVPNCMDNMKNGMETDVDCGGMACPKCANGKTCNGSSDCLSGICTNNVCVPPAPTCNDMIKNGSESDTDCGGNACPKCADGKSCGNAGDCLSGVCTNGKCAASACNDMVKNGNETDVDCGGNVCSKCNAGKMCMGGGDCVSGVCVNNLCQPSCNDGQKNGMETDIDCGGNSCAKCADGKSCAGNSDCVSGNCVNNKCAPAPADMAPSSDMVMVSNDMVPNSSDMGGTLRLYIHASAAAQMACGNQLIIVTWGPNGKEYRSVAGQPLDILIDQSWGGYIRTNTICNGAYKDWSGVANQTPVTDYDVYQVNGQNETKTWVCPLNGNGPKLPQTNMDGSNPC